MAINDYNLFTDGVYLEKYKAILSTTFICY